MKVPEFSWMRRMADHAELTDEVLPGETIIELIGKGRVLVEGHKGVSAYSDEKVSVKVRYGIAEIIGCNLKLTQMSVIKLVVSGDVTAVHLLQRATE